MHEEEARVAKKHKMSAKRLSKAKDRIINAYISDAQRVTAGVGMTLQFLRALTKAMGYKVENAKSDDYFYVR
jgi:hypothetical protein